MELPSTYYNNNEDYITIPAIKQFIANHPGKNFKTSYPREELLEQILSYADTDANKEEEVLQWVDKSIQEGIKDIFLEHCQISDRIRVSFKSKDSINDYLCHIMTPGFNKHICQNKYTNNFALISAVLLSDEIGKKIQFVFCKRLRVHDKIKMRTKVVDYPVTAEYYIDSEWLLIKAKPRSNLYIYDDNAFDIETAISTTTEKQIQEVRTIIMEKLDLEEGDKHTRSNHLRTQVFYLLHNYTNTPQQIASVLSHNDSIILNITSTISNLCNQQNDCNIPEKMITDIQDDINNIVEKYLSINWTDKSIFIKDREAYPIKLSATDEEESKVEQSAALTEPLQTKALFFDNKKMLYKSEMCDGVVLQWKRKNPKYFTTDSFKVKISVNTKGVCVFKFSEYTSQEDIENVVFTLIQSKRNT